MGSPMQDDRGPSALQGFITEIHLDLAEVEFPGIRRCYETSARKNQNPRTFLDLLVFYWAQEAA